MEAQGEFIVIASAHVYPLYKNWLEELLKPFQDQKIGLVYGRQAGGKDTRFSEHQVFSKWFPEESDISHDNPFCNNANSAIRKKLWEIYPYDEDLTGLEDIAWAKKCIHAGYNIAYQAEALVVHLHYEKPVQTYNRYRREAMALKKIFPEQKFRIWDFIRLYFTNVTNDYLKAIRSGVFIHNWYDIVRFRLMQFWGTYRGFVYFDKISDSLKKTLYYPNQNGKTNTSTSVQDKTNNLRIDYSAEDCSYDENN